MIIATVTEQTISLEYSGIISDSVRFLTVKFVFDSTWDGTLKTAVFSHDGNEYNVVMQDGNSMYLGDNICYVPQEVIKSSGFNVSVYGVNEMTVITSSSGSVAVEQSGYSELIPADPTPSLWFQMLEITNKTCQLATSVRQDADMGLFNGKGIASGGTTGQVLIKNSLENYDTAWQTLPDYLTREEALQDYVPKTRKINGKPLSDNISITCDDIGAYEFDEDGIPKYDLSERVQSSLSKADTAIQVETDPTVPEWAKQSTKPTYTAQEVGALPNTTRIPVVDRNYSATSINAQSGLAVANALKTKQDKTITVETTESNILLSNNRIYIIKNATSKTFSYPSGNFDCLIMLTTATSGTVNISFPASKYIGRPPVFGNGETWEISIKNKVIVAGKVI
ncbi:MAG: hypothetical protein MJ090_05540 [Clostridia bacterium]|nr:hypothetical protein [Clostridia bacterium]